MTNFPWVHLDDIRGDFDYDKPLYEILYDMFGVFNYNEIEGDVWRKTYRTGPKHSGRHFVLACEKATQLLSKDPNSWWNYGVSLELLGRSQQALEAYLTAKDLTPENPIIWRLLSELYLSMGDVEECKQHLRQSFTYIKNFKNYDKVKLEFEKLDALINKLSDFNLMSNSYEKLIAHYINLEQKLYDYQWIELWQNIAVLFYKIGDVKSSSLWFKKAIIRLFNKTNFESKKWYFLFNRDWTNLTNSLESLKDQKFYCLINEHFIEKIKEKYSESEDDPYLAFLYGRALFYQGDKEEGLLSIYNAVSLCRENISYPKDQLEYWIWPDLKLFLEKNNLKPKL